MNHPRSVLPLRNLAAPGLLLALLTTALLPQSAAAQGLEAVKAGYTKYKPRISRVAVFCLPGASAGRYPVPCEAFPGLPRDKSGSPGA